MRQEIEQKLRPGRKLPVQDSFWGQRIKPLAQRALVGAEWTAEERAALADMLQELLPKLMALEPKEIRKQLKLNELRGAT